MSLDADYRNIQNWQGLYEGDQLHVKWQSLIFATMAVGIGEITTKNVNEFWERLDIVQAVTGPFLRSGMSSVWFTRDDVIRLIGLKTNVFPKESKANFLRKMSALALEKAIRQHKHRDLPPTSAPVTEPSDDSCYDCGKQGHRNCGRD